MKQKMILVHKILVHIYKEKNKGLQRKKLSCLNIILPGSVKKSIGVAVLCLQHTSRWQAALVSLFKATIVSNQAAIKQMPFLMLLFCQTVTVSKLEEIGKFGTGLFSEFSANSRTLAISLRMICLHQGDFTPRHQTPVQASFSDEWHTNKALDYGLKLCKTRVVHYALSYNNKTLFIKDIIKLKILLRLKQFVSLKFNSKICIS